MELHKDIVWRTQSKVGLEYLTLRYLESGIRAESRVIGLRKGQYPYFVYYQADCDNQWMCRHFQLTTANNDHINMQHDGLGNWKTEDGTQLNDIKGCLDLDIEITPFINMLVLHRLNLSIGTSVEIKVASLDLFDFTLRPIQVKYSCLTSVRYSYHNFSTGYSGELTVDTQGVIEDYKNRFRRVFAWSNTHN
jgi:uncharacterized protein